MQAITGDETGLIKLLDLSRNQYYTYGEQSRDLSIESLSWVEVAGDKGDADADADADDVDESCTSGRVKAFAALRANGALEAWKLSSGALVQKCSKTLPDLQGRRSSSRLVQLQRADDPSVLLCVNQAGSVFMNKLVATPSSSWAWNTVATFQAHGPISACATCCGSVALGGKENDVSIYDLATHKVTWQAKNVPYDTLRLRVPIWVVALSFLQPAENTGSDAQFVTGTGYRHVRLYDVKASQQPVVSIETNKEHRVTTVQPMTHHTSRRPAVPDHTQSAPQIGAQDTVAPATPVEVVVGYASGLTELWDLRMQRRVKTLRGASGSIRCSALAPSGMVVANVGLDRFLRVYDVKAVRSGTHAAGYERTTRVVHSCYLKSRLNSCLLHEEGGVKGASGVKGADEEEEDEDEYDEGDEDADDDIEELDSDDLEDLDDPEDDDEEEEEVEEVVQRKGGYKKPRR